MTTLLALLLLNAAPLRATQQIADFAEKHPLHPYIMIHDRPKVEQLKRQFPELYRESVKTAAR